MAASRAVLPPTGREGGTGFTQAVTLASWRSLQHPQLGEVRRNAPRFVLSQQVRGRASPRIILEMDIRQPDRSCVADDRSRASAVAGFDLFRANGCEIGKMRTVTGVFI